MFESSHMYPENPEGTQEIVGSVNMGSVSDTTRNQTRNLFHLKCMPIPLSHSDEQCVLLPLLSLTGPRFIFVSILHYLPDIIGLIYNFLVHINLTFISE